MYAAYDELDFSYLYRGNEQEEWIFVTEVDSSTDWIDQNLRTAGLKRARFARNNA